MSTNSRFKDREGNWQDMTEWHNVVVWGKRGESLAGVLLKGAYIVVEGELRTRSYETTDGQKRTTTEVIAKDVELTGRRGGQQRGDYEENQDPRPQRQAQQRTRQQAQPRSQASFVPGEEYDDQDPATGFG